MEIKKAARPIRAPEIITISTFTSKTATAVVSDLGAREIIYVSNSKVEGAYSYDEIYASQTDAEIIFNTSPVGMYPNTDYSPFDALDTFPQGLCLL